MNTINTIQVRRLRQRSNKKDTATKAKIKTLEKTKQQDTATKAKIKTLEKTKQQDTATKAKTFQMFFRNAIFHLFDCQK